MTETALRDVGRGRKGQINDDSNHGNLTPDSRDNKRRTLYIHFHSELLPVQQVLTLSLGGDVDLDATDEETLPVSTACTYLVPWW